MKFEKGMVIEFDVKGYKPEKYKIIEEYIDKKGKTKFVLESKDGKKKQKIIDSDFMKAYVKLYRRKIKRNIKSIWSRKIIGDWRKKKTTDPRRIEYFNEIGGYGVQVKEQDGSYLATPGRSDRSRRFSNKRDAMEFIMNFMRKHPKG